MTLNDVLENFDDLSFHKKFSKMKQVLNYIEDDEDGDVEENLLHDLLVVAQTYEQDDYFGTEGLK
jgi:hypothetical protein